MSALKNTALVTAVMASCSGSAFAFFDELVLGMTSVTNNLIDSTESVTNNTVNTASTTMLSLSSNPGKMADRIGLMADRIGFMADRIVTTEGIMAGLAHKIIDSNSQPRVAQHYASTYAPAPAPMPMPAHNATPGYGNAGVGNPYTTQYGQTYNQNTWRAAPTQTVSGNPYMAGRQTDNSHYSASQMIYGVSGATYTAARTASMPGNASVNQSAFGFSAGKPSVNAANNHCGFSYGVARSC